MKISTNNPKRRRLVDAFNRFNIERGALFQFAYENRFDDVHIISKEDGFIDYLVRKKKIKPSVLHRCEKMSGFIDYALTFRGDKQHLTTSPTDMLIMILAVQEKPVETLLDMII